MITIRKETDSDHDAIRYVNRRAFWQEAEGDIVDKLRVRNMAAISLVAVEGDRIIGHILFSPVTVEADKAKFEAIALAPMAVLPEYQKKGIGTRLLKAGLDECRKLGYEIVFVLGHPEYYPRFGFTQARTKGIGCEFEVSDEAWMVLELKENALAGRKGVVKYQPEFSEAT
jgi:putative acetyltransferase